MCENIDPTKWIAWLEITVPSRTKKIVDLRFCGGGERTSKLLWARRKGPTII